MEDRDFVEKARHVLGEHQAVYLHDDSGEVVAVLTPLKFFVTAVEALDLPSVIDHTHLEANEGGEA